MQCSKAIFALFAVAFCLEGCHREIPSRGEISGVAKVGDVVITAAQLQQKLDERHRRSSSIPLTAADRDAALEELVQFEAFFAQAQKAGWHTNAEVLAGFKRMVVSQFQEKERSRLSGTGPTPKEIEEYWDQHASLFTRPEQIHGAILVIELPKKATPEVRAEAVARATELRERARVESTNETHFGVLAQRYSVDQATRYAGGDFGFLTSREIEHRYGAELLKALNGLKIPGELSAVVETPRGLGLVKLIERRPESRPPLAEVRDGIAHRVTQAKRIQTERDIAMAARSAVEVRVNRPLLESLPLPNPTQEIPLVPGVESVSVGTP